MSKDKKKKELEGIEEGERKKKIVWEKMNRKKRMSKNKKKEEEEKRKEKEKKMKRKEKIKGKRRTDEK